VKRVQDAAADEFADRAARHPRRAEMPTARTPCCAAARSTRGAIPERPLWKLWCRTPKCQRGRCNGSTPSRY